MNKFILIFLLFYLVGCIHSNEDYELGIKYSIGTIAQQNNETWNKYKVKLNEPLDKKGREILLIGENAFVEYNKICTALDRLEKKKNIEDSLEIIFNKYCQELYKDRFFYTEYQQVFSEMQNVKLQSIDLCRLFSTILLKYKIDYLRSMVIYEPFTINYMLRVVPTKDKYNVGEDCLAYLDVNYFYANSKYFFNKVNKNGKSVGLNCISFDKDRRMVKLLKPEKGKYNISGYSITTSNHIFLCRTDTVPIDIEFTVE